MHCTPQISDIDSHVIDLLDALQLLYHFYINSRHLFSDGEQVILLKNCTTCRDLLVYAGPAFIYLGAPPAACGVYNY